MPVAEPRSALVRVATASVNPSDVKNVAGAMEGTVLPCVPGRDFAGTVVEGPAAWIGAEVCGPGVGGAAAQIAKGLGPRVIGLDRQPPSASAPASTALDAFIGLGERRSNGRCMDGPELDSSEPGCDPVTSNTRYARPSSPQCP